MFLDIQKFHNTPLITTPYEFMVVENFVRPEYISGLSLHFPQVSDRGSFSKSSFDFSICFENFLNELEGLELRSSISEKFSIDLSKNPIMTTIRGKVGKEDGKIHIDSKDKLITLLLYMNENWHEGSEGNLRMLNSPNDIEDYSQEVRAKAGTLIAFKCTPHAWHGHKPFDGNRRAIQLNYITSYGYLLKENLRHRVSSFFKSFKKSKKT